MKTPDVFLLTYDSYVGSHTFKSYGIENVTQERFLRDLGFKIYPHTYSTTWDSISTMSGVLDMKSDEPKNRWSTSGDGLVLKVLEEHGYQTYGVLNPYLFRQEPSYDFSFPPVSGLGPHLAMLEGLRAGNFLFTLVTESGYRHETWVNEKRRVLSAGTDNPKFLYAHSPFPGHSQNSGKCREDEIQLHQEKLKVANEEMRLDIKTILASRRDAIIIINGDHGPYLTGDCLFMKDFSSGQLTRLHLQDRVGAFLAIRWPTDPKSADLGIVTLQQTFEAVFKYLFEVENVLLVRPSATVNAPSRSITKSKIFPAGAVVNGIIEIGKDSGKPLFEDVDQ
jgi:hypothetical protein